MTLKIQHKRSAVKAKAPQPTDLEYGEIAVNYETSDPCIYIKDSANKIRRIGAQPGVLVFKGTVAPTSTAPAAPDTGNVYIMNAAGVMDASWTGMAGKNVAQNENIAWSGTQWETLGSAYTSATVTTSDTAPTTPKDGDLWYDSVGGQLYVWYDSDDAGPVVGTWVQANPQSPQKPALWKKTGTTLGAETAGDVVDIAAVPTIPDAGATNARLTGTTCKAWVNFNGDGSVPIRASYNVSSITDNGTGNYTVNFTKAMPDANYAVSALAGYSQGPAGNNTISAIFLPEGYPVATTGFRLRSITAGSVLTDNGTVCAAIFR